MNLSSFPLIMLKCLMCTIIIELIAALILRIKDKKDLLNIILVNIVTNPIVVSLPILVYLKFGYTYKIMTLYSLEVLTIFVEGFIYSNVLKYKKIDPFILSFILNLSSYLIGEIINMF